MHPSNQDNDVHNAEDNSQEDNWSHIMTGDLSAGSFAKHDTQEIHLPNQTRIQIASTVSLSPLDMMDLSWGTHDATGHRIWMGAELWIQAMPFLSTYFSSEPCRCLELGSGTGLAGIATYKYYRASTTLEMVLSDNSPSALDLCRFNCEQNGLDDTNNCHPNSAKVELLTWGSFLPSKMAHFDVIFATDVIYDTSAWTPLLETSRKSLRIGGHLLISHVPRAALPVAKSPEQPYHKALESYLIQTAKEHGFCWKYNLHPKDLHYFQKQQEIHETGAAILIFQVDNVM